MTTTSSPTPIRPSAPTDPVDQLAWLVDRARISDLLVEFARTLDDRDWQGNTALYMPDGIFMVGDVLRLQGHAQLAMTGSERGLAQYHGTWHASSNHAIQIDGDTARTRSYLIGVHLLAGGTTHHADGGGWYDCTLQRTADGWRFTTVRLHEVWHAGQALPHVSAKPDLAATP
ncbi:nuclear transport factor 2 family protein [Nakamurella sp. PAMC28650]|uniref:nuclear transport factor 2 family protein n=1 Tax=Nakamurella sp. PAMC28650 TaxID=2762325 RepID=UPI00164D8F83|nr:nuclear transport factor 2 family protein [Nakamurella sp. PAMC28650]QNK80750.1 nuclear transport factor 2 family protein [Nakamurella sp. PAMC28650]